MDYWFENALIFSGRYSALLDGQVRDLAVIIPERVPSNASQGVRRLFAILSQLPDDYLIYYEPLINPSRPDYIIISPYLGLLVIEIRPWYASHIRKITRKQVHLDGREKRTEINPVHHCRQFLEELVRKAQKTPLCAPLLEKNSITHGFRFPTGNLLILPNCSVRQLTSHPAGNLFEALGCETTLCKEVFSGMGKWDTVDLLRFLKSLVSPHGIASPLTCDQIHSIRAVIHDEIVVDLPGTYRTDDPDQTIASLKILDRDQEKILHHISSGHHLLYGPAGSGKTAIMISRCALLHTLYPDIRILVLCQAHAHYEQLKKVFHKFPRVEIQTFQRWAEQLGISRKTSGRKTESDADFGERCFECISGNKAQAHVYDAVFIDEGDRFAPSWFRCAREALKDPESGDLCIVADSQKGMNGPQGVSWGSLGIHLKGHIHHLGMKPVKEYHNTREILSLARLFFLPEAHFSEEYRNLVHLCDCQTRSGLKPLLIWNTSHEHQAEYAIYLVQRLLSSIKSAQYLSGIRPDDIAILYPYAEGPDKYYISSMIPALEKICPVQWVSEESAMYSRVDLPGLKIHDAHSIRDLTYRVVMIIFAENFERFFSDSEFFSGRNLFYMALTRPIDYLTIQYTDRTEIIRKILDSGYVDEFMGK